MAVTAGGMPTKVDGVAAEAAEVVARLEAADTVQASSTGGLGSDAHQYDLATGRQGRKRQAARHLARHDAGADGRARAGHWKAVSGRVEKSPPANADGVRTRRFA